jgi:hypothetical protein
MTLPLADDELLATLAAALEPAQIHPSPLEFEQLRRALDIATMPDNEVHDTRRTVTSLRRLRHPVAAVVAVAVLTTGGAAAAVSTNTLPGPLRNIAFSVGLPVTSPALEQVDGDLAALRAALKLGDAAAIRSDASTLRRDLAALGSGDRVTAGAGATLLLTQAGAWMSAHPPRSAPVSSDGSGAGTDEHAAGSEGTTGGDGSDSGESDTNGTNTEAGGDDNSSNGATASGSTSGDTSDGGSGGDGGTTSGATSGTTQVPVTEGGGGTDGTGDGGSSTSDGGGSSSDGGGTSTSGGGGSPNSGSGSSSSVDQSQPSQPSDSGSGD